MVISSVVKTMIPFRWLAVGSHLGFVAYGALHTQHRLERRPPGFGFQLMALVAGRPAADVQRLKKQVAETSEP